MYSNSKRVRYDVSQKVALENPPLYIHVSMLWRTKDGRQSTSDEWRGIQGICHLTKSSSYIDHSDYLLCLAGCHAFCHAHQKSVLSFLETLSFPWKSIGIPERVLWNAEESELRLIIYLFMASSKRFQARDYKLFQMTSIRQFPCQYHADGLSQSGTFQLLCI